MRNPAQTSKDFDLEGAKVTLQEVVDLHRRHQDHAVDDDARALLVSAVSRMEWTMQDLEDYGQCTELSAAALEFRQTARAAILEARQALTASASKGQDWDTDGYDTEDDTARNRAERSMNEISRHTADLHAEPAPAGVFQSLCCCWRRSTAQYQQLDRESVDQP